MEASASIYTRFSLSLYDIIVLTISNSFAWRCPTGAVLLPFYKQHLADHGIVPAQALNITPLPSLPEQPGDAPNVDRVDASVPALAVHCAAVGITEDMVLSFLFRWARSYLESSASGLSAGLHQNGAANSPEDLDEHEEPTNQPPAPSTASVDAEMTEDVGRM